MSDTTPNKEHDQHDESAGSQPELLLDSDEDEGASPESLRTLEFVLPMSQNPDRLDKVLAALMPEHSRSRLQGWIEGGHVHVNEERVASVRHKVVPHDRITVREQLADELRAFMPEAMTLDVIAESPDWIVVNKPAGLVTHPGAGNWQGTLLNGL
ncbi:MAG TPA: S4 domain-containing protein, partial [Burkholderiaceae bacterium]|nr:S4 domain-containing protein [Burkholderiaceae bacterium]